MPPMSLDFPGAYDADLVLVIYRRRKVERLRFFLTPEGLLAQITQLDLTAGAAATHVTVVGVDADNNQTPIPPADVTWALDASLSGVSFVADATGFNFSAPEGTAAETGNAVATYTVNGVTGTLPVVVSVAAITSLIFTSP
jgi:hypothetical protein